MIVVCYQVTDSLLVTGLILLQAGPARSFTVTVAPSNDPLREEHRKPNHSKRIKSRSRPKKKHSTRQRTPGASANTLPDGTDAEEDSTVNSHARRDVGAGKKHRGTRGHSHSPPRGGTSKRKGAQRRSSSEGPASSNRSRHHNRLAGNIEKSAFAEDSSPERIGAGREHMTGPDRPHPFRRKRGAPVSEGLVCSTQHHEQHALNASADNACAQSDSDISEGQQLCPEVLGSGTGTCGYSGRGMYPSCHLD